MKTTLRATMSLVFVLIVSLASQAFAAIEFTLPGSDGKSHSLAEYKDAKAVVVLFISTRCPVSNGFNERMVELAEMYQQKGVVFLGIYSNKMENLKEIKKHAADKGFPFVVLKDDKNVVADAYKAKVTPEAFMHDNASKVLYHGRIDDSPKASERKNEDLKSAIDDLLAGGGVSNPETKAFGCTIKRD
jgi:peroxiredoxin